MKEAGVCNQIFLYLLRAQHHIRAGIPVEGKVTVTVRLLMNESQRRMNHLVHQQIARIDTGRFHDLFQMTSKSILPYFSNESRLFPELFQHRQYVAGCAARIGFQENISLRAESAFGKIDQQLSESRYVKFSHCCCPPDINRT